eukprot:Gregarina_sp_Poly_1__11131@NODE_900_length_5781_cov_101_035877_g643_i0_p1_GENE_NODE_900_length_5781_cov_101_035877_g643_i0NODE_900_length_5781_cov_101_035877_g643_i0_p1_ORF_typecomplete_len1204_score139_57Piwi/PF02171_17/2_7e67PAZ/PF02170_22/5_7e16ArgoN/PF16486_5/6_3e05ArgoMid/PF16487_5/0_0054ArgoMid/PF16487_5/9_1e03ArgoL2/PF16488_5/0_0034_NODE_900_length_5781_cov_101_035877_g643_i06104221
MPYGMRYGRYSSGSESDNIKKSKANKRFDCEETRELTYRYNSEFKFKSTTGSQPKHSDEYDRQRAQGKRPYRRESRDSDTESDNRQSIRGQYSRNHDAERKMDERRFGKEEKRRESSIERGPPGSENVYYGQKTHPSGGDEILSHELDTYSRGRGKRFDDEPYPGFNQRGRGDRFDYGKGSDPRGRGRRFDNEPGAGFHQRGRGDRFGAERGYDSYHRDGGFPPRGRGGEFCSTRGQPSYREGRGGRGGKGAAAVMNIEYNKRFEFLTNCFKVDSTNAGRVWVYRVEMDFGTRYDDSTRKTSFDHVRRRKILFEFLRCLRKLDGHKFAYDGDRKLVTQPALLAPDSWWTYNMRTHRVERNSAGSSTRASSRSETPKKCPDDLDERLRRAFTATKVRGKIDIELHYEDSWDLHNITNRQVSREEMHVLDIIFKESQMDRSASYGRGFYVNKQDYLRPVPPAQPQLLWYGSVSTINCHVLDGNVSTLNTQQPCQSLLTVNSSSIWAFDYGSLQDWIRTMSGGQNCFDFTTLTAKSQDFHAKQLWFKEKCRGLSFESNHCKIPGRDSRRIHKIYGLYHLSADEHVFEVNGQEMSVTQYMKDKWNVRLRYPQAPLVQLMPERKKSYLPFELLYITRQKIRGKLTDQLKKLQCQKMVMSPDDRYNEVKRVVRDIWGDNPVFKWFGIEMSTEFLKTWGTVLEPPIIEYLALDGVTPLFSTPGVTRNGEWTDQGGFFLPQKVMDWVYIDCVGPNSNTSLEDFCQNLAGWASKCGMAICPRPRRVYRYQDRRAYRPTETTLKKTEMKRISEELQEAVKREYPLDFIIAGIQFKPSMDRAAGKECLDAICPSSFIVLDTYKKKNNNETYFRNVLRKINMKRQGINHIVARQVRNVKAAFYQFSLGTMQACIMGADLTHPSVDCRINNERYKAPSYAGLVCSFDEYGTRFLHSVRAQEAGSDIIQDFREMLIEVLDLRCRKLEKQQWPKCIVYLRDGVSDGDVNAMVAKEVDEIDAAYRSRSLPEPKLLVLCVKKRHETRFFPTNHASQPMANLPAGTIVVDNLATLLPFPNFFLLSHRGIKGTSHPTKYVLVRDDLKELIPELKALSPEEYLRRVAALCFEFCHQYGRCDKSVSLPAAVAYAHLLADRVRDFVHPLLERILQVGSRTSANQPNLIANLQDDSHSPSVLPTVIAKMNDQFRTVVSNIRPMFYT